MDNFWMWFSFLCIVVIWLLWRKIRWLQLDMERVERAKTELRDDLTRLEYLQLSQQIQPHFIFNALNLLMSLARLDRRVELLKALEHLALFLRSGYTSRPSLVEIGEEIDLAKHYLAIQQMRYGERLTMELVCSETMRTRTIIPYLLQTFVENAFKHGLEKKAGPTYLKVILEEREDKNYLSVIDNGPGIVLPSSGGDGLRNLRRRLNILFGNAAGLDLVRKEDETLSIAWWPKKTQEKNGRKEKIE